MLNYIYLCGKTKGGWRAKAPKNLANSRFLRERLRCSVNGKDTLVLMAEGGILKKIYLIYI